MSPEYANLATAIDARTMLPRLRAILPSIREEKISIENLEIPRVFFKPEGEFMVQYQLDIKNYREDKLDKILLYGYLPGTAEAGQEYPDTDENIVRFDDIGLMILKFPFDPSLKYLSSFTEHDYVLNYFKTICKGSSIGLSGTESVIWEILSYKLKRRCVIKYSFYDNNADKSRNVIAELIAKFYRFNRVAQAEGIARSLENNFSSDKNAKLAVPHVLYADREKGLLLFEVAPGNSLHFYIKSNIFEPGCAAAGNLLRKLQTTHIDGLSNHTFENELVNLASTTRITGAIFPGLQESLNDILGRLAAEQENYSESNDMVLAHRDFYDKQVIYSEKQATLLDCDNAAYADPALDCANFLAHLRLRQLQFPGQANRIGRGAEAFNQSYGKAHFHAFGLRVKWWQAATLLRLVSLYSLRPRWHHLAATLLSEAGKALDS